MPTIYKSDEGRISVAEAKRLIIGAMPEESMVTIVCLHDENGNEIENSYEALAPAVGKPYINPLHHTFADACKDLGFTPRRHMMPTIKNYASTPLDDSIYTVSHAEFVQLAELYGASVVVGDRATAPTARAGVTKKWTPEFIEEVRAYRKEHGPGKTAEHFGVTDSRIREKLSAKKAPAKFAKFWPSAGK